MKLITGISLLITLTVSSAARADWTLITDNTDPVYQIYIDFDTLKAVGGYLRAWELIDYEIATTPSSGVRFKSSKTLKEYDCANEQTRTLALTNADGNMGGGAVVSSDMDISKPTNWSILAPNTNGKAKFDAACNFRTLTAKPKTWGAPVYQSVWLSISLDRFSFLRRGNLVRTRVLYDHSEIKAETGNAKLRYFSTVYGIDFDCENDTFSIFSLLNYSKPKSEGSATRVIASEKNNFDAMEPGHPLEKLSKVACLAK